MIDLNEPTMMANREIGKRIKVFLSMPIPEPIRALFDQQKKFQFDVRMSDSYCISPEDGRAGLADCEAAIITPFIKINKEALDGPAKKLKFIASWSVGVDHIDLSECKSRKIPITLAPYLGSAAVAECAIGLLLNVSRNITTAINISHGKDWTQLRKQVHWMAGNAIKDSVVGIFGLGNIGMNVAKRLAAFETKRIIYKSRTENLEAKQLGFEYVEFDDLLRQSDFVICTAALNRQTEGVFNKRAFELMKSNAILINVSRGQCVNQDDLYDALKSGEIAAAGLDVTTPIVLPSDHKLYSLPNCIITPYLGWAERATIDARLKLCVENTINFFSGKPLRYELKPDENLN